MYEIKSSYYEGLHVLRGLAAVSVVFFHASHMPPVTNVGLFTIVDEFGAGVTLFFVLSAFSLTLSNAGKTDDPGWIRAYAIKRFFRIAPLWYFMIFVSVIYFYLEFGKTHSIGEIARQVLPLYPFIEGEHDSLVWAGWTIGVEVIFYLIFPILLSVFRLQIIPWIVVTVLAILVSINFPIALSEGTPSGYAYMGFPRQFPVFCIGALLCVLILRAPSAWRSNIRRSALLLSVVFFGWWTLKHLNPVSVSIVEPVLFKAVALGALTVCLFSSKTILYNPLTKFWGDASYGIYLLHPIIVNETKPVMKIISNHVDDQSLAYLLYALFVVILVSALAKIVHWGIENPFFNFGRALAKNENAKLRDYWPPFGFRISWPHRGEIKKTGRAIKGSRGFLRMWR